MTVNELLTKLQRLVHEDRRNGLRQVVASATVADTLHLDLPVGWAEKSILEETLLLGCDLRKHQETLRMVLR